MATKTKKNTKSTAAAKKSVAKTADMAKEAAEQIAVEELCPASDLTLKSTLGNFETREIETPTGKTKFCVVSKDGSVDTRNTDPKGNGLAVCEAIMGWAAVLEHIGSEAGDMLFVKPVNRVGKYGTMALEQAKLSSELDETEQQMHDTLHAIAVDNSFKKSWRATAVQLQMIERSKTRKGGSKKPAQSTEEEQQAAQDILDKLNQQIIYDLVGREHLLSPQIF